MSDPRASASDEVAEQLRIRASALREGDRLPTVRELMAAFGVGQITLQRAIGRLTQEGVLIAGVGRGLFVGSRIAPAAGPRKVLVLTREQRTDRSDIVAGSLHRELLKRNWRSAVLTYSDFAQATELVRNATRFDASVVHPRLETLPLALLAALRARSRAVVVEGYATEGIDVDGIAVDWPAAVVLALQHLMQRGHRRIGLVTIDRPTRPFASVVRQYRSLHGWAGLDTTVDPVLLLPPDPEAKLYPALAAALQARATGQRQQPFTALIFYVGPYRGEPLLATLSSQQSPIAVAALGFTDLALEHAGQVTTIGQPCHVVTEAVATAIEERWKNPAAPHACHYIQPELVVRASTTQQVSANARGRARPPSVDVR